jgi:hypothetical protein
MEYKFIEVLSLNFQGVEESVNKQSVSYRFGLLKNRMNLVQSRLNEISTMVKLKNPSLLQSLHKPTAPSNQTSMKRTVGGNGTGSSSVMGSTARQGRF